MTEQIQERRQTVWPPKYEVFGIRISAATHSDAVTATLNAAMNDEPAIVSAFAVHALVEAASSPELGQIANRFAMITADGQPVRWSLNWLYGVGLKHNVRGSDLMWQLCKGAADKKIPIYLYGSMPETLDALSNNLLKAFPQLIIAGVESPPFRKLSTEEDAAMVERINASGAKLIFLGLGCPKQDYFAAAHADRIRGVQVCVGAAFDFHAGTKKPAPKWMQVYGLEWCYRLGQEPKRLWKRYLVTNSIFLYKLAAQSLRQRTSRAAIGR